MSKYITIGDRNFTHEYNECMFKPIKKHYSKASSKATFPIIAITSRCMKIGEELLYGTLKEKQSFSEETFNNSIKEATKKFYAEEDELIKTLPVTYYTRRKEQLISFIYDSISAGVSFSLEVVTYLNADSNKELEMLQNCSV